MKKTAISRYLCATLLLPTFAYAGCENPASTCYVNKIKNALEQKIDAIPMGPIGPRGFPGQQGANGATGAQGPQGATGATGAQGPQGDPGAQGATGATGAQGPQGETGPQGATGATGAQGPQGETGDTGPQGPAGTTGATGSQGPTGATGATGPQGPAGPGTAYSLCDQAQGGIVFYTYDSGAHGLIAATSDVDTDKWTNIPLLSLAISGSTGNGIGAGAANTTLIVAREALTLGSSPLGSFAAADCIAFARKEDGVTACSSPGTAGESCYADWYLPSQYELNQLYLQGPTQGACAGLAFTAGSYWSSTESTSSALLQAYSQNLTTGVQTSQSKTGTDNVRCIRRF
jgi:hypothetical protein